MSSTASAASLAILAVLVIALTIKRLFRRRVDSHGNRIHESWFDRF